jgi:hypothetical protein
MAVDQPLRDVLLLHLAQHFLDPALQLALKLKAIDLSSSKFGGLCRRRRAVQSNAEDHAPVFMPVQLLPEPVPLSSPVPVSRERTAATGAATGDRRIEIALPDGTCIRVVADVGLAALRRAIAAVRR